MQTTLTRTHTLHMHARSSPTTPIKKKKKEKKEEGGSPVSQSIVMQYFMTFNND